MQERSPENRRTDGIIENYSWSEGGRSSASFLSPLLLHAGNRYSPLSLLDIAPRIINAIVSLIRGVNASGRVENSDQPAGYSRLKADSFAQLCGALLYYSLEFAPDVFP